MKYTFSLFIITLLTLSASAQLPYWKINTVAGNGTQGFGGDGFFAMNAALSGPISISLDSAEKTFYFVDFYNRRVRQVTAAGVISTVAGSGTGGNTGDGTVATSADMNPHGVVSDRHGSVFISDPIAGVIRKVNKAGIISRYAGTGIPGNTGNGGSALGARLDAPFGMAVDAAGNLYIADAASHVVRKVSPGGTITRFAGNDTAGYAGDFGLAVDARLDSPFAVAVDRIGNVYISDHRNNVIRKVDTAHIITTYAGTFNVYGHTGDGGLAIFATLNAPKGLTIDTLGNLYICDADNHVIRKVDTAKKISTFVATGAQGFGGDLGQAIAAQINNPYDVAIDKNGSLFIADANNQRIRKVYNAVLLGVNNVAGSNIAVYPNPAADNINVSGLTRGDNVIIYDIAGRQVANWQVTNDGVSRFSLGTLTTGIYQLLVSGNAGDRKSTVQIVKE